MFNLSEQISKDLGVSIQLVEDAIDAAHRSYKKIRVTKRSGGVRVMVQPAAELKMVQEWLQVHLLQYLPVSTIATAFEPGTSIVKNARVHASSQYSVRVDISDFFPSIRLTDLYAVIARESAKLPSWAVAPEMLAFLSKACFDKEGRLPIGYPTSPKIANVVMRDLDDLLARDLSSSPEKFGNFVLTRYADDFVFSTDLKGACRAFVSAFEGALAGSKTPKLKINAKKTKLMSRKGGSTLITGLRINQQGKVGVHQNYRDHVRLLLKLYSKSRLKAEDLERLRGHLAFIEHADPHLFTRLSFRYVDEIATIRR